MSAALCRYLTDFGAPEPARPPRAEERSPAPQSPVPQSPVPQSAEPPRPATREDSTPAIDLEAERAEAFALGRKAAAEELEARHGAALAAMQARHAEECRTLGERLEGELAARIGASLSAMRADLAVAMETHAAHVFAPLLDAAMVERMAVAFAGAVRAALAERGGVSVRMSGPQGLCDRLRALPEMADLDIDFTEADGVDLTAEIDGELLSTRLARWREEMAELLA